MLYQVVRLNFCLCGRTFTDIDHEIAAQYPYIMVSQISIQSIITEQMEMRKVCVYWVLRQFTNDLKTRQMGQCWTSWLDTIWRGQFIGSSSDRRWNLGTQLETTNQAIDCGMEDNSWICSLKIQNMTINGESEDYSILGLRGVLLGLLHTKAEPSQAGQSQAKPCEFSNVFILKQHQN